VHEKKARFPAFPRKSLHHMKDHHERSLHHMKDLTVEFLDI